MSPSPTADHGGSATERSLARAHKEIDEELSFHLHRAAEDLIEQGYAPSAAAAEARVRFGDLQRITRECRGIAMKSWLTDRRNIACAAAIAVILALAAWQLAPRILQPDWHRISPFEGITFTETATQVKVAGTWYELLAIDDASVEEIHAFCLRTYRGRDRAEKRFAEDIYDVLRAMGQRPGRNADLTLRDPKTGERIIRRDVPMTHEKRQQIWLARHPQFARPTPAAAVQ